jgi:MIP family channel proteins
MTLCALLVLGALAVGTAETEQAEHPLGAMLHEPRSEQEAEEINPTLAEQTSSLQQALAEQSRIIQKQELEIAELKRLAEEARGTELAGPIPATPDVTGTRAHSWAAKHQKSLREPPPNKDGTPGTVPPKEATTAKPLSFIDAGAEMLAMTLFVIIGCGTAMALPDSPVKKLQVSLAFGLGITTLAYAIGHYSGGQINCAVTLGLCLRGACSWTQGFLNFAGQMLGSVFGALILFAIFDENEDTTGSIGSNAVNTAFTPGGAFLAELIGTFLLVFVVLETATNPATKANVVNAPIAIGVAVFLAHCMLIPITGCSINPTRSFGPMLVRKMFYESKSDAADYRYTWIFWVAPLCGAALAAVPFAQAMKG